MTSGEIQGDLFKFEDEMTAKAFIRGLDVANRDKHKFFKYWQDIQLIKQKALHVR